MKKIHCVILIVLIMYAAAGFAGVSSYYCEKNFKLVNLGDSMDKVRAACGAPASVVNKKVPVQTPMNVTQWIYTLGLLSIDGVTLNLPSLTITFSNNRIVQIEKNNIPVTSGGYCNIKGIVNLGDSMNDVYARCGRPNFISQRQIAQTTTKEIIEWIYNFGPYRPQVLFDFENSALTEINMGQLGNE